MEKSSNGNKAFEKPLYTEKEFKKLCSYLEVHNPDKRINVKRESATMD
jgi:hypothetical protein